MAEATPPAWSALVSPWLNPSKPVECNDGWSVH